MQMRSPVLLMLTLGSGLAGCQSIALPNWCRPGYAHDQRKSAEVYDPYPEADTGPDTAARPPDFDKPRPEEKRVQNSRSFLFRYGQPPALTTAPPADAIIGPPLAPTGF